MILLSLRMIVLFAAGFACVPVFAQVDRIKGGRVDGRSVLLRYVIQSASPQNIDVVPDPAGSSRSVVRARIAQDDAKVFGGLRSEIVPRGEYVREGVRWYTISFYVPPDWRLDPNPVVVAQLHTSQNDVILSPPVSWVIQGSQLQLELRSNHRALYGQDALNKQNSSSQIIVLSSLQKSKWYCFVARADWSSTIGKGSFRLWLNGSRIYDAVNMHNNYESRLGNYPKIGVYAPGGITVPSQHIYVDGIHLGGPRTGVDEMTALTPCGTQEQGPVS